MVSPSIIICKVIPKASTSKIVGWEGEFLRVRLAAVPEKGKANEELIRLLAEQLHIPKRDITLVSGETSRQKRVRIDGLTIDQIKQILVG